MENDLLILPNITIPSAEIQITASRSGGPGGQHVNKTSTQITVRWNVQNTLALNEYQKMRVLEKLQSRLTSEYDLVISNSTSRSQNQNKVAALNRLAELVRQALYIPKTRMKTRVSRATKEARLKVKSQRATIKQLRSKKINID